MTQTVDQKASAAAAAADAWLSAFQQALTARDADAAAALFADESYWRDIVAFTWNITTAEGRAGVADLLRATLDQVDPTRLPCHRGAGRGGRRRHRLDRVRDHGRAGQRAAAARRRQGVHAAHHPR